MNLWFTRTSSVICFLQTKANASLFCNLFAELRHFFPFRQRREQSLAIKNAKKGGVLHVGGSLDSFFLKRFFSYLYTQRNKMCIYFIYFFYDLFTYQSKQKRWWWENDVTFCALKNTLFGKPISKAHDSRRYHFKRVCLCVQQIMIRIQKYRQ